MTTPQPAEGKKKDMISFLDSAMNSADATMDLDAERSEAAKMQRETIERGEDPTASSDAELAEELKIASSNVQKEGDAPASPDLPKGFEDSILDGLPDDFKEMLLKQAESSASAAQKSSKKKQKKSKDKQAQFQAGGVEDAAVRFLSGIDIENLSSEDFNSLPLFKLFTSVFKQLDPQEVLRLEMLISTTPDGNPMKDEAMKAVAKDKKRRKSAMSAAVVDEKIMQGYAIGDTKEVFGIKLSTLVPSVALALVVLFFLGSGFLFSILWGAIGIFGIFSHVKYRKLIKKLKNTP